MSAYANTTFWWMSLLFVAQHKGLEQLRADVAALKSSASSFSSGVAAGNGTEAAAQLGSRVTHLQADVAAVSGVR